MQNRSLKRGLNDKKILQHTFWDLWNKRKPVWSLNQNHSRQKPIRLLDWREKINGENTGIARQTREPNDYDTMKKAVPWRGRSGKRDRGGGIVLVILLVKINRLTNRQRERERKRGLYSKSRVACLRGGRGHGYWLSSSLLSQWDFWLLGWFFFSFGFLILISWRGFWLWPATNHHFRQLSLISLSPFFSNVSSPLSEISELILSQTF